MYQQPLDKASMAGVSNVLGIISMVAGILGLLTSGMFSSRSWRRSCRHLSLRREKPRRGFAIAGLVTGYAGLAIGFLAFIGLLALFSGAAISSL